MADLTQDAWRSQFEAESDAVLLDVRTQDEVDEGAIPGAIHIDIFKGQGFIDEVSQLDVSKAYYVYCRSGNRSGQACAVMQQLGFEKTYNLLGGFNEWEGEVVSK